MGRPGTTSREATVCVVTRDATIAVLSAISRAPITRWIRRIRSEVESWTGAGPSRSERRQLRQPDHHFHHAPRLPTRRSS